MVIGYRHTTRGHSALIGIDVEDLRRTGFVSGINDQQHVTVGFIGSEVKQVWFDASGPPRRPRREHHIGIGIFSDRIVEDVRINEELNEVTGDAIFRRRIIWMTATAPSTQGFDQIADQRADEITGNAKRARRV